MFIPYAFMRIGPSLVPASIAETLKLFFALRLGALRLGAMPTQLWVAT
jgi:hypothetical protein